MLELKNISKSYQLKDKKINVLEDVSYKFQDNKMYCIIGKSGAGKTTLIEMLGLLLKNDSGKILINNKDISTLSANEKAQLRNQEIGFVFQSFYLNPLMKAYENVMLPMYLDKNLNNVTRKEKALKILKSVDLSERVNHFPKNMSGGEQQRVAIARALANDPSIILADEPTGNLDPENATNILEILKSLAKDGKCVIIVSHDERVKKYADTILNIANHNLHELEK